MSKEKKEQPAKAVHKTKIGGQALVEGVMMKGAYKGAMACRLPDGTMDVEIWDERNGKNAPWYKKTPLIRGIASFIISLIDGYKYTMKSAEKQMVEEEEEELTEKQKKKLEKKEAKKAASGKSDKKDDDKGAFFTILMVISCIIGLGLAVVLFMWLPKWLVGFIPAINDRLVLRSLFEGIVKVAIFILYMWLVGFMKDTRRTYEYHGAEHKTIACYEARLPLTVENVKKQTRLHPRCGTSFIFIVLIISILVMCLVPFKIVWQRVICSLCLLPIVVSVSYEFIRFAGRSDSVLAKILSWPGLQLQRITTREPDASQIECAIAALKPCIPENEEDDIWG